MKRNQLALSSQFIKQEFAFGGALLKGNNPKRARPLDSKLPIHLVLKSSRAVGELSFRRGSRMRRIEQLSRRICQKYGVRIYQYGNSGNHLHLILRLHKRFLWKAFICELTSKITAAVIGFGKLKGKFWDARPFTRVVSGWGKDYKLTKDYVALNILESIGLLSRQNKNWRAQLDLHLETGPPAEFT